MRRTIIFHLFAVLTIPFLLTSCGGGSSNSANLSGPSGLTGSSAEFTLLTGGHVLAGAWGDGSGEVFVCGERGLILHRSGGSWDMQITPVTFDDLNAIWGSSVNDVWAVGESGVAMHYNGTKWTQSVTNWSGSLKGVWGASSAEVWAVGTGGTILRYRPASGWVEINSPISANINGIGGTAANNIFAAAEAGTCLVYDGSTWNVEKAKNLNGTPSFSPLRGVWVAPNGDAFFAIDYYQFQRRLASGDWAPLGTGQVQYLYGVGGTSETDYYGVGQLGTIVHYSGSTWTKEPSGGVTSTSLQAVWADGADDVYAIGNNGNVTHRDATSWTLEISGQGSRLKTMWGTSEKNLHIVGQDGLSYRYNGSTFEAGVLPVNTDYYDSWGFAADDIYAVSSVGMIHYNGISWGVEHSGGPLHGIWGAAPDDIVAVGLNGVVLREEGSGWTPAASIGTETLNAIHGIDTDNMYVAASGGKFYKLDSSGVTDSYLPASTGTSSDLKDVWAASTNDVFIVGASGTVLRFNGTSFTTMSSGVTYSLNAVWGTGSNDVWAVGSLGVVIHYNGSSWTATELNTSMTAHDVFGFSPTEVFVSLDRGSVLKLK